jgi:Alternative complex III, ActD subunit
VKGRPPGTPDIYGLMAEFHTPDEVVNAAHRIHDAGYRKVDGYSPYPMEELSHALGVHHSPLPKLVLAGGITGLLAGWGLEYWAAVIEYPMNIGGRPFNSWPAFIIPGYETTILFAATVAVLGMLALNGLPEPYHPVFNVPAFALASRDKFFICIEARDPKFDRAETRTFLASLSPDVYEVEH